MSIMPPAPTILGLNLLISAKVRALRQSSTGLPTVYAATGDRSGR